MTFIAHIRNSDNAIQTVEEHLREVMELAESYGGKIGVKHIAGLAGMLHDMGKFTEQFKNYILDAVHNPNSTLKRGDVDHSTAGGKHIYNQLHTGSPSPYEWILAEIVGNAVISHHSYLHDFLNPKLESDYLRRVRDKSLNEFETAVDHFHNHVMSEEQFRSYISKAAAELEQYLLKSSVLNYESRLMFLSKYIFSVLIDADRTNTRLFEENKEAEPERDCDALFKDYYAKLMEKLNAYQSGDDANTPINMLRREMSEQCDKFAENPSGLYTLSIPTGGGKTLASLRYALKHAIEYGKKRIIYVVPFTTIIEQNAEEVRRIIQDDGHLLEHHSNVIEDADDNDEMQDGRVDVQQKLKLAKDNWDAPIIFTTMVQFLDVFYAKGSRNVRRLHNLTESVVIFDEVQKVPISCVSLFNQALNFLKEDGLSSLILCTATQPALNYVQHKLSINTEAEIIGNLDQVLEAFKRVEIIDQATEETFNNDALAGFILETMEDSRSVLVILNTKSVVKELYERLREEINEIPIYHLSTSMCAAHRKSILENVKDHLHNEEKVICISTQLIEAGVDVSFECVIRSLAGLDSIAQAAGRCNRHGKQGFRKVYVIDHRDESLKPLPEIKAGKEIARKMLIDLKRDERSHGGNILSAQAIKYYFMNLYTELNSNLNYHIPKLGAEMIDLLSSNRKVHPFNTGYEQIKKERLPLFIVNSYRTAAEHFRVIDNQAAAVIVPYGPEGKDLIAQLNGEETIEDLSRLIRKAQQYSINLFDHERDILAKNDGLVSLLEGKVWALKEGAYNEEYGLDLDNDSGMDICIN